MQKFYRFVEESYTAFHAAHNIAKILEEKGFKKGLNNGLKFYVSFDGAIAAFIKPKKVKRLKMFHAHTDSPALKLKPNAAFHVENMNMLAVEVYGAPLLSSWTNRDLKIAGRDKDGKLIALNELATLPQLAIHLDREVNEKGLVLNPQAHLNLLTAIK
ncbi:MAG: M18 family aminopeptidase, partial [Parachlamydiaceae bacterium]